MKKIMIANGGYTAKDGTTKTSWKEVGVIMTSAKGGEFCLLDPTVNLAGFPREAGKDKLIASIFEDTQERASQDTSRYKEAPAPVGGMSPTSMSVSKVPNTEIPLEITEENIPF